MNTGGRWFKIKPIKCLNVSKCTQKEFGKHAEIYQEEVKRLFTVKLFFYFLPTVQNILLDDDDDAIKVAFF